MRKIDHRKILKHLYRPSSRQPSLVEVPPMNYLMMDGRGKPDGKQFPLAAGTLFPLAYTIKYMVRFAQDVDFHVMPMEVCWQVNREKKEFGWTMMLMQPEYVTAEMVAEARSKVQPNVSVSFLEKVRFEQLA
jgi:hypothetical protein